MKTILGLLAFLTVISPALAGVKPAWHENPSLARQLVQDVQRQNPAYAISQADCRTLNVKPQASTMGSAARSQCLVVAKDGTKGTFCGVLAVDAPPLVSAVAQIEGSTAFNCGTVRALLHHLRKYVARMQASGPAA